MKRDAQLARYRRVPDRVVLQGKDGPSAGGRPPVRIFLGTEDGQWRAERIFVYSIEQARDPDRTYEIHLMKNLDGFDRRRWRTGFSNYRYAVPELAGFEGRAIYNDVDQIYFTDPAELFDLDMEGHGYLSVSAADTSVMLMDCERMRAWWTRQKAATGSKRELLNGPAAEPGLWDKLDDCWNARDMEFVHGESKLLHFTALHLQPWRPFPEQYSYHAHPLGDLWLDMERQADAEGFQVYGPERPSPRFAAAVIHSTNAPVEPAVASSAGRFIRATLPRSVLAATRGGSSWNDALPDLGEISVTHCPVGRLASDSGSYDLVAAPGLLHTCPAEDVPWIIESLFERASRAVWLSVRCCRHACREADVDVHRAIRPLRWWHQQVAAIARRYPHTAWQLDAWKDEGPDTIRAQGQPEQPPAVWVLEGAKTGDNAQLRRLAEALGWPAESKPLDHNKLHMLPNALLGASLANLREASRDRLTPPWPDVVIASGKRNSGVARWIKRQSGGRTKLIHVGRPWARLDAFDLIITTPQYRLPLRDNVHRNPLPITPIDTRALAQHRDRILDKFAELPRPRIALLVGGDSWSYTFGPSTARRIGQHASRLAGNSGGSLLVATGPRTRRRPTEELFAALDAPCRTHDFNSAGTGNRYLDFLAVADKVVVTGDSASMIADAMATGREVDVLPLPRRTLARLSAAARSIVARSRGSTYRGTPRQQGPMDRLYDEMVVRGIITPPRDLEHLHALLSEYGSTWRPDTEGEDGGVTSEALQRTVERVRQLFNEGKVVTAGANGVSGRR